jgi:hypothetical protein
MEPPIPIRKPLTMIVTLHKEALVNRKEMQYEKAAAAGPKKRNRVTTPPKTPLSDVVKTETSNANIKIT